jgi:galactose mutarotase-like enzyme
MPAKSWKLTDAEAGIYVEHVEITPADVGGSANGYSVAKRRLKGGLSDGVDVVRLDNGALAFDVLPTRGMGIWKAYAGDMEFGWKSPVRGPVHPSLVPLMEPGGLGWLDGFDELLCRCGLESNGAPEFGENGQLIYPLHGRIANRPAHKVELSIDGDTGEIVLCGEIDETRLFFNKLRLSSQVRTRVGQPGLTIRDTVTNISAQDCELELLYHINFGNPLLTPGARVVLPVARMAPRDSAAVENLAEWDQYGPETPGSAEAVFFFELAADASGQTQTLLKNAAGDMGVSLNLNRNQLPYFSVWKNRQAAADGYVTGLEPAINFPNPKSFEKEKGRVARLAPGESRSFEITMEIHAGRDAVAVAESEVQKLQSGTEPQVLKQPDPEWSAA